MATTKKSATAAKNRLPKASTNGKADPGREPVLHLRGVNLREMSVRVYGTSPLVVHRFGAKYGIRGLAENQGIYPKSPKKAKDPVATFLDTLMTPSVGDKIMAVDADGDPVTKYAPDELHEGLHPVWAQFDDGTFDRFVFPAHAFRESMGSASYAAGVTKNIVSVRRLLSVSRVMLPIETPERPQMHFMVAYVQGKADLRFRAHFAEWAMQVTMRYTTAIATAETILNILRLAGTIVGVGEMRPEKKVGTFGTFDIDVDSVTDRAL